MTRFKLRFPERDILHWAKRYSYPGELEIKEQVAADALARGYLTAHNFLKICRWKSPRSASRCAANNAELIEDVTKIALSGVREEIKIGILIRCCEV